MIFDLFHSISDPEINGTRLGGKAVFDGFLDQVRLAESIGFDTVWLAESHFSSETQKSTSIATIPNFQGEVGLNADSFQLIHWLVGKTKKINFGTGIHNIVGGSGGPIASADRANFLRFLNANDWGRTLRLGVASGRFPYQNAPFGFSPRTSLEKDFWPTISRTVFLEALEIFLRLLSRETLSSEQLKRYQVSEGDLKFYEEKTRDYLRERYTFPVAIPPRWEFEALRLVPGVEGEEGLRIVLGSSDPRALDVGFPLWDLDLFNLSFTPPERLNALHAQMAERCAQHSRTWHRERLPRTVMVFTDSDTAKAKRLANEVLDNYIEAMRGTAQVPNKSVLLERALVGDASEIRDQLHPDNPRGFHPEDRLMLWFEFNQNDSTEISSRMRYFHEGVISRLT